jgi:hypothetical protein
MRLKKFKAELLSGHKESAVEVPFDPEKEWGIPPQKLWSGRHGHPVTARVKGIFFASSIIPREKKFYLLIDAETQRAARIVAGNVIEVSVRRANPDEAK